MAANAASFSIEETSIAALHAAYLSGRATAVSVCKAHLDRIAAYDRKGPALGAIIINNPDALADAAALDAALLSTGRLIGPLHGIPVLVKDNYDVAGLQTTGGSAALLGWVPAADATVIAKIRAAGGIILAKTTMSEWARGGLDNINSVLPGFARNPYNTAYATGGSSGGTGSGLAASFGVVGLGSDTFGSIRNPASNNALLGCAQVGRWFPGPAWLDFTTSATPPVRWPAPLPTSCDYWTSSLVSTRRTRRPPGRKAGSRRLTVRF
jgi:Asp-tRNA(Asn)/Glu-tRNA(Gln) amidotransferase A subunit family amidase